MVCNKGLPVKKKQEEILKVENIRHIFGKMWRHKKNNKGKEKIERSIFFFKTWWQVTRLGEQSIC
jgi:hypothetical protein